MICGVFRDADVRIVGGLRQLQLHQDRVSFTRFVSIPNDVYWASHQSYPSRSSGTHPAQAGLHPARLGHGLLYPLCRTILKLLL